MKSDRVIPKSKGDQRVLRWCNSVRKKYKLGKPVKSFNKGIPNHSRCVLRKTIGDGVVIKSNADDQKSYTFVRLWMSNFTNSYVPVPKYVARFIHQFDFGKKQEYELPGYESRRRK